jgi:transcriptional regulator with XRE-family HTH domain
LYASESSIAGARLRAAREASGLSLKDVAAILGTTATASALASIEAGKGSLTANYELPLVHLLDVPLETLLYGEDELANVRRRVERLRRQFGLPGPSGGRKADAA